jgi:hypothetical protein
MRIYPGGKSIALVQAALPPRRIVAYGSWFERAFSSIRHLLAIFCQHTQNLALILHG